MHYYCQAIAKGSHRLASTFGKFAAGLQKSMVRGVSNSGGTAIIYILNFGNNKFVVDKKCEVVTRKDLGIAMCCSRHRRKCYGDKWYRFPKEEH